MTNQERTAAANRRIDCLIRGCKSASEVIHRGPGHFGIRRTFEHIAGCPNDDGK